MEQKLGKHMSLHHFSYLAAKPLHFQIDDRHDDLLLRMVMDSTSQSVE